MKTKLLFFSFFLLSIQIFSQEYIFGKVSSESGTELQNVTILNVRTDEKAFTDKNGNYMISARTFDELRFVKNGYDRFSSKISVANYIEPMNISLIRSAILIDEVQLAFHATGDLKKDIKNLAPSKKVIALNSSMSNYMRTPLSEVNPTNSVPSSFAPRNLNEGQISLFNIGGGGGLVGLLSTVLSGKSKRETPPNVAEIQDFYRRVKGITDLTYYQKFGLSEYDFDIFLAYADDTYNLAKRYRKNFNNAAITTELKVALVEYLKTHKIIS